MKSRKWSLLAFIVSTLIAYFATRGILSHAAPSATVGETRLKDRPSASHRLDEEDIGRMRDAFAGHEGAEQEAERLKIVARAANLNTLTEFADLTPGLVELLGLTETEAEKAQQCLDQAREKMAKELKEHLTISNSDAEALAQKEAQFKAGSQPPSQPPTLTDLKRFEAAACPEEGEAIMTALRENLRAAAGPVAAEVLLADGILPSMFGDFGQYPLRGSITNYTYGTDPLQSIEFEILDSNVDANGQPCRRCSTSGKTAVQLYLGNILDDQLIDSDW